MGMGVTPLASLMSSLPTFSATTVSPSSAMMTISSSGVAPTATASDASLGSSSSISLQPQSSLPPKLIKKILDLEYVDMAELVPEFWRFQEEEQKCCHQVNRTPRRGPVTDILLWVECFASMVDILYRKYPDKTSHFMTYLKTIVHAHKSFIGDGWVTYDACYRRKAAVAKSLDWGHVDFTLYNETFTGRAKAIPKCRYCMSEYHSSVDCTYAPDNLTSRLALPSNSRFNIGQQRGTTEICHLFNTKSGNKCRFTPCRFSHICSECHGSHPRANCRLTRPPPPKVPRQENRRQWK